MPSENENVEEKPVEVNKWDGNAVKNALDDAVRTVVQDKFDYTERTRLIDMRLFISTVSVALALFALLWDWLYPFPKSRWVLVFCVLSYFALMGVLQLYAWVVEGSIFYVATDEDPTGKAGDVTWTFSSKLKRFDHMFTLEIDRVAGGDKARATLEKSIGSWIDEVGQIDSDKFSGEVLKLHDSLSLGKKKN